MDVVRKWSMGDGSWAMNEYKMDSAITRRSHAKAPSTRREPLAPLRLCVRTFKGHHGRSR